MEETTETSYKVGDKVIRIGNASIGYTVGKLYVCLDNTLDYLHGSKLCVSDDDNYIRPFFEHHWRKATPLDEVLS